MEFKLYDRDINKNDFIGHSKLSINDLVNKLERNKNQCVELRLNDEQNQKVTAVLQLKASIKQNKQFKDSSISKGLTKMFRGDTVTKSPH